ncbi:MAG: GtrA family protein [Kiritimatiellae bacterium]|nr:GtrA family protein [Kiritimatiellia bacterium]
MLQFVKYAIVGGIATGVNIVGFFVAGWLLFPCLTGDDILVRLLSRLRPGITPPPAPEGRRAANAVKCNVLAFVLSNAVCYILNRLFVFTPGQHSIIVEALLFFAVSAVSMTAGTTCQTLLISRLKMQTTLAFSANLFFSLAFNFVMRKFVIFQG